MPIIQDKEFGKITVRRSIRATQIRIRVAPDGTLRASLPPYAPLLFVRRLLKTSRDDLRKLMNQAKPEYIYTDGMKIGKSHTLIIQDTDKNKLEISKHGNQIIVKLPNKGSVDDPEIARQIRDHVITALKKEAKHYLPRRLEYLAEQNGFKYLRVRFSHASGRWGSCSSNGTISLNVALMKLPHELIDYVIIHELSHTVQMNHSLDFWKVVAGIDTHYKLHRKILKTHNPSI